MLEQDRGSLVSPCGFFMDKQLFNSCEQYRALLLEEITETPQTRMSDGWCLLTLKYLKFQLRM